MFKLLIVLLFKLLEYECLPLTRYCVSDGVFPSIEPFSSRLFSPNTLSASFRVLEVDFLPLSNVPAELRLRFLYLFELKRKN